jgi:hypothetical protein
VSDAQLVIDLLNSNLALSFIRSEHLQGAGHKKHRQFCAMLYGAGATLHRFLKMPSGAPRPLVPSHNFAIYLPRMPLHVGKFLWVCHEPNDLNLSVLHVNCQNR